MDHQAGVAAERLVAIRQDAVHIGEQADVVRELMLRAGANERRVRHRIIAARQELTIRVIGQALHQRAARVELMREARSQEGRDHRSVR